MFTPTTEDSVRALGEIKLIAAIRGWLGEVVPPSPEGMGDDCAVIDTAEMKRLLLTTDSVSYGQHFDATVSARNAGAKLVKRNLSDIAAMGGLPGPALLNLLCGPDLRIDWLHEFIDGMREVCEKYAVPLVGGDVSPLSAGQFTACLSLTGHLTDPALLRSGAHIGDAVYVTGTLGGSRIQKHYGFEPRLAEGQWLAQCQACSALIDLTDGLAKDLRELIPEGGQAQIELGQIPLSEDAVCCAAQSGRDAIEHAFCDGEDYELLFAVKGDADCGNFEASWRQKFPDTRLTRIGRFCEGTSGAAYLDAQTKAALPWQKGFEHLTEQ